MTVTNRSGKYVKFFIYMVVMVLVNLVGATLFFRADLTSNDIYSLSKVSKEVVSTLTEPMTIKAFFTKDLPAPHNNTERYLRDLLKEYALQGNRYFNYQFHDVSPQSEGDNPASDINQEMAAGYGIHPVQIQQLETDEIKFKRAYMGLVIIHGDVVERIPTITNTEGLEYKLTTAMQKANRKISTLRGLAEDIQVNLILSESLQTVAPLMGLDALPQIPQTVREIVEKLNLKNYDRLSFTVTNPSSDADIAAFAEQGNVISLKWPALDNGRIPAGKGAIGLVMTHAGDTVSIPLLRVLRLPLVGTQYQLTPLEDLAEMINDQVEALVDINENIGYLADHGCPSLTPGMSFGGNQDPQALSSLYNLMSDTYSPKRFRLADDDTVPADVRCIIVARPTEPFSDYELFQLDQALMRGQNLAIFLEPFKEVHSEQMSPMGFQNPQVRYEPLDTGLEKLLDHWGLRVKPGIVMDENCFKQPLNQAMGGGQRPIYFAPVIKAENVNQAPLFMRNIKQLIALKAAPIEVDENALAEKGLTLTRLFSSSDKSWEMKAPINLNPQFHHPPGADTATEKKLLACMVEGRFPSYFAGKPMPEKTTETPTEQDIDAPTDATAPAPDTAVTTTTDGAIDQVAAEGARLETGLPAKIFLIGSGDMLRNDIIDGEGRTPNAMLVMNVFDALNGREDVAIMRAKTQKHNPLADTSARTKTAVKVANIAGLPILVVVFGLLVWSRRHMRKKAIERLFER